MSKAMDALEKMMPPATPNTAAIRKQIREERNRVYDKVVPEIAEEWKVIEERQAADTAERNASVQVHRERMRQRELARQAREAAEEAAYQEVLTEDAGSVLLLVGGKGHDRQGGSPESKEGQMPKLTKKQAAKSAAKSGTKAEKKGAFCLMTGQQTTGSRFSGLGTDAKYKSLLVNTALGDPKGEVAIFDHETGTKSMQPAIQILKALNWTPFLEKARASRKAKADAAAKRAQEAKAAAKTSKKAAGTTESK